MTTCIKSRHRRNYQRINAHVNLTPKHLEEFYIRIHYDGIRSYQLFVRLIIEAYLNNDMDLLKCLTNAKKKYTIQNIKVRSRSLDLVEKGKQQEIDFKLSEEEVKNLYDLLENDLYDDEDFIDEEMSS